MSTGTATTVAPSDLTGVREAVLDRAGPLRFSGAGTKLGWGVEPADIDLIIQASAMTDVLAYDAADATVAVQAGVALADLQRTLAEHDQWLAIDPPHVDEGATVGGVLASNDTGPLRVAYGTMRDLVIGATYVLADGSVGRTGGYVIKNVAGYDMAKLLCGSLGTLAFVAEVVLRVHPRPASSSTLRVPADATTAAAIAATVGTAPVEPVAFEWTDDTLWIRFAGQPDAVSAQMDRTADLLGDRRAGADAVDGDDEVDAWDRLRAGMAGTGGQTVVRAACLPAHLPAAARACAAAADASGVDAQLQATVPLGVLTARVSGADAVGHVAFVDAWRAALTDIGGHAVVRRTDDGVAGTVDVWGPPPSAIALMRRVKRQLDPDGRCAPGTFVGGM
ncbi:FAD-binding oxidoreductase [soil metagenome]